MYFKAQRKLFFSLDPTFGIDPLSVFQWIETWYNRRRMHSTLGYKTIEEFEIEMYHQKTAA